tara:strand:+ start:595 stop:921 length:327 start_codon:yes stop_codon:yes gene_type:complete
MLLRDLSLPINAEDARGFALVFAPALAVRLGQLHAAHGSSNCVPVPLPLTDGRLMLGADVLTEIAPGGLLATMWGNADQTVLGASVEVIAWEAAVAMLPPPEPMPWGV